MKTSLSFTKNLKFHEFFITNFKLAGVSALENFKSLNYSVYHNYLKKQKLNT